MSFRPTASDSVGSTGTTTLIYEYLLPSIQVSYIVGRRPEILN